MWMVDVGRRVWFGLRMLMDGVVGMLNIICKCSVEL